MLILACLSDSSSDALSGLGKFTFINPGLTLTKSGPGFEISAGKNGLGSGDASLLGALARYEFQNHRMEAGMEFGMAVFLVEAGLSFSDTHTGEFIAPDLCLPIALSGARETGLVLNLFYRIYPGASDESTFGGSLKFAWTWL